MIILADLFVTFIKIGMFTFGGGYAMLTLIENTCVKKKQWITHEEMMNLIVVAESTPGPVAINCATFVGYKQKGFVGALIATLGMILSSFWIIFAISMYLDRFLDIVWIEYAFRGIKIAVGILIVDAALKLFTFMQKKWQSGIIVFCVFVAMLLINIYSVRISAIMLMLAAGFISLALFMLKKPKLMGGTDQ